MIRSLAAASLLFAGAAMAGIDVQVPSFTGINTHSGARVVLRHGTVQHVSIVKGDAGKADIHVNGKTLDISACKTWCWNVKEFVVEVVSPRIEEIEAHGGGALNAEGDFPKQPRLNIEAHGGGAVNVRAIPADSVHANAHGGGAIRAQALVRIDAEAHGGGAITYYGNPAQVNAQTGGGGAISRQ